MPSLFRRAVCEAIGTFFLVFAGTGAVVSHDLYGGSVTHVGVALTFGLVVMVLIYAIGGISGAHMNPAVSLGFVAAGRFRLRDVPAYLLAQAGGALAGSVVVLQALGIHPALGETLPAGTWQQSFLLEGLLSAFLMFVVLCVSRGAKEEGIIAGLVIGAVIALEALFAGPVSGASMNPARSLGPAVVSGSTQHLWVYLVAPVIGTLVAAPTCLLLRCEGEPGTA